MKKLVGALSVAALVLMAVTSNDAQAGLSASQKLADYRQLVSVVEQNYAPLRWKQRTLGLDWPTHVETYRERVRRTTSDIDFYQELTRFLMGLGDAHVSVNAPSTLQGKLGFLCDYIDGKVLIETVDRLALPQELFPFNKGDQLVAIGDQPVDKLLEEFSSISSTGYDLATKRLAAAFLTYRREARGFVVPRGVTTVTVLPRGATQPRTVAVTWSVRGRPLLEVADEALPRIESPVFSAREQFQRALANLSLERVAMPNDRLAEWAQAGLGDIGAARSMFALPSDAQQLPFVDFTAATFTRNGQRIGVLRIPQYGDEMFAMQVARALAELEPRTDVLILDQTNNPGGFVSTVSTISSFFARESIRDVQFALRPSRKWLGKFQEINGIVEQMLAADPNDAAANALKARFAYLEELVWSSLRDRVFLTTPFSLDLTGALGVINPSPAVRYTKPVLMLINEFDFSGGDVFPAIMRDSNRAVLFGHRTSGAGGNVDEYGPLTNSGLKFNLTESLIIRPNGQFIENLGVAPQIEYKVTDADFMDSYKPYFRAASCEALKLVATECPEDIYTVAP